MNLLKNKNFILIMIARLLINFADSLFYILVIWHTSKNLDSVYYTSIVTFLFLLPEPLLIFLGPMIDRLNQKKLLIYSLLMQVIFLIVLIVLNNSNIIILSIIVFLSSFMSTITYSVEEVIIPQIVSTEDLVPVNSIIEITYKIFDSLFNGIAGSLLITFSTVTLLKLNVLIFILPFITVTFLNFAVKKCINDYNFSIYTKDLKVGLKFIKDSSIIYLLLPLIFINLFNSANAVLLPFFSDNYVNPAKAFGLIMATKGLGGLAGAILINKVKNILPAGKLLSVLLILNGLFWILFILTGGKSISYVMLFIAFICFGMQNIIYSSLIQGITPINVLGRVSTAIDSIITVAMPFGALIGGVFKNFPFYISLNFSAIACIFTGIFYISAIKIKSLPYIDNIERMEI